MAVGIASASLMVHVAHYNSPRRGSADNIIAQVVDVLIRARVKRMLHDFTLAGSETRLLQRPAAIALYAHLRLGAISADDLQRLQGPVNVKFNNTRGNTTLGTSVSASKRLSLPVSLSLDPAVQGRHPTPHTAVLLPCSKRTRARLPKRVHRLGGCSHCGSFDPPFALERPLHHQRDADGKSYSQRAGHTITHTMMASGSTGYAVDLPSPLREYPPSSLHVSSFSPPASPRPYAAPDSVCACQRQRQQEPQGGRGWELHLPLHVFLPLSSLSLAAYPQYGSPPQQPHSASAAGLAPSPHACMSSLGHSHSPGSGPPFLRVCARRETPRAREVVARALCAANSNQSSSDDKALARAALIARLGGVQARVIRCAVEDARGGVEVARKRHARSGHGRGRGSSSGLYPKPGSSHGELLLVVIVVTPACPLSPTTCLLYCFATTLGQRSSKARAHPAPVPSLPEFPHSTLAIAGHVT
ncbi:hypothetical protein B0H14DRAFT_3434075 [Mycena olivaceomarginata]|nr:hypothetical protein B0H14DRAFT_3434075 [Mycena olivaceomarginata]